MYSGLTVFSKHSGSFLGAHQKIDRVARRQLVKMSSKPASFPPIKQILHFEGVNGPDGIKHKNPGENEPWHFVDPFNDDDIQLAEQLTYHYINLVTALKKQDLIKSAFEAAWLSHALVDGLTPAHHYPYESEMSKLRGGESKETRNSIKKKIIMPGETKREKVSNNWKMWGTGGLYTTHASFELGVATLIKPLTFKESLPTVSDLEKVVKMDVVELFNRSAREVAVLYMYDRYIEKGWTPKLAWQVRHQLGPTIIRTVSQTWYKAMYDAKLIAK